MYFFLPKRLGGHSMCSCGMWPLHNEHVCNSVMPFHLRVATEYSFARVMGILHVYANSMQEWPDVIQVSMSVFVMSSKWWDVCCCLAFVLQQTPEGLLSHQIQAKCQKCRKRLDIWSSRNPMLHKEPNAAQGNRGYLGSTVMLRMERILIGRWSEELCCGIWGALVYEFVVDVVYACAHWGMNDCCIHGAGKAIRGCSLPHAGHWNIILNSLCFMMLFPKYRLIKGEGTIANWGWKRRCLVQAHFYSSDWRWCARAQELLIGTCWCKCYERILALPEGSCIVICRLYANISFNKNCVGWRLLDLHWVHTCTHSRVCRTMFRTGHSDRLEISGLREFLLLWEGDKD